MSSHDHEPERPTQDYFVARLSIRVSYEPLKVIEEWGTRFTELRERGNYQGCRSVLQAAKGWPDLPDHCRGIVYYAEGWFLDRLGEPEQAIVAYLRARDAFTRSGTDAIVPTLLTQIGSLHHDRGNLTSARDVYDEALVLAKGSDRGRLLVNIGNLDIAREDPDAARIAYTEALDLLEPTDHHNVGAARQGLGNALQSLDDLPGAQAQFAMAHKAFRESGDVFGAAGAAASLGVLEILGGNPAQAVELLEHSLTLFHALQDTRRTADTLNNLAIAHNRNGDPETAASLWHESAAIYRELHDDDAAAAVRRRADQASDAADRLGPTSE